MYIKREKKSDGIYFTVDNISLAREIADELKEGINNDIENGEKNIYLNLEKVEVCDSAGVGKLLFLNKKIKGIGGIITINKINENLYDFFKSLALDMIFSFSDS